MMGIMAASVIFTGGAAFGLSGKWASLGGKLATKMGLQKGLLKAVVVGAVKQAGTGAITGALGSAISGQNPLQGALMGAGIGAATGGVMGGIGHASAARKAAAIAKANNQAMQQAAQDQFNQFAEVTGGIAPTGPPPPLATGGEWAQAATPSGDSLLAQGLREMSGTGGLRGADGNRILFANHGTMTLPTGEVVDRAAAGAAAKAAVEAGGDAFRVPLPSPNNALATPLTTTGTGGFPGTPPFVPPKIYGTPSSGGFFGNVLGGVKKFIADENLIGNIAKGAGQGLMQSRAMRQQAEMYRQMEQDERDHQMEMGRERARMWRYAADSMKGKPLLGESWR